MSAAALRVMFNVPNTLCWVRLIGAPVLLVLAHGGSTAGVIGLFVVLLAIDMVDGRLARRLHQRTRFGARLDTIADVTLFICLGVSVWMLRPDVVTRQRGWLFAAAATYALSVVVSVVRFARWPSYHTRLAKMSGTIVAAAAIAVLLLGEAWPIRVAAGVVCLTNLEAAAVSLLLRAPRTDVPSAYHAWRIRRL